MARIVVLGGTGFVGRRTLAVPPTPVTQRQFLDTTADALGVARPGWVPAFAAAAVAGRLNAEVMTLDALARPRALEQTGFRFRFDDLRTGIADAVTAIDTGRPARTA